MTKLIVQIPCLNEESTLRHAINSIPRQIDAIDIVEVLVVDDGSTDGTIATALNCGADHVVRHNRNMGLAAAFVTGLDACLAFGADIIVNTDGDNQYDGAAIPCLVRPILEGRADVVIGDRRPSQNPHFPFVKRQLQALGSFVVRAASGIDVPDAVSGFRAFNRKAALRLNVTSTFSHTIETLIQAKHKQLTVAWTPIRTNPPTRESRLFHSLPTFIARSTAILLRIYAMYHPLQVFVALGCALAATGAVPILRFLYLYSLGRGQGHVQSLVLGGVLLVLGFLLMLAGLIAELIAFNRKLLEAILERVRRLELAARLTSEGNEAFLLRRDHVMHAHCSHLEMEQACAATTSTGPGNGELL